MTKKPKSKVKVKAVPKVRSQAVLKPQVPQKPQVHSTSKVPKVPKVRVYKGKLSDNQIFMVHELIVQKGVTWKEAAKAIGKSKKSTMDDVKGRYPELTAKVMKKLQKYVPSIQRQAKKVKKHVKINVTENDELEVVS